MKSFAYVHEPDFNMKVLFKVVVIKETEQTRGYQYIFHINASIRNHYYRGRNYILFTVSHPISVKELTVKPMGASYDIPIISNILF